MNRTTIVLPTKLKQRASQRSREMGVSFAEFVRLAIRDELARTYPETADSLYADNAVFEGDAPSDAAGNHDDLLYGKVP